MKLIIYAERKIQYKMLLNSSNKSSFNFKNQEHIAAGCSEMNRKQKDAKVWKYVNIEKSILK